MRCKGNGDGITKHAHCESNLAIVEQFMDYLIRRKEKLVGDGKRQVAKIIVLSNRNGVK